MVVLLVFLTVAGILLVEYFLRRDKTERKEVVERLEPAVITDIEGVVIQTGLAYHPSHCWVREIDSQTVLIGIDDFARRLIGRIDSVVLPSTGVRVEAGQGNTLLRSGKRLAPVASPVSGEVVEVNKELNENPELISSDPYGRGWLFRIRSGRLGEQLSSLLGGSVAKKWMELSVKRLRTSLGGAMGAVAQDGGELLEDIGSGLAVDNWIRLVRDHLGTEAMENGS